MSEAADMLSVARGEVDALTPQRAREILAASRVDLLADSFHEQRAFVKDTSRFKAACCTRRAAKSYSVGTEMVESAMGGRWDNLIIGLTRESVKDAFWDKVLKAIIRKHDLPFEVNEASLEARCKTTGGLVRLLGMDANDNEKRKALGGKRKKVNIDEAQDFRIDLEKLIVGTLLPSLADYDGSISMTGTPNNMPRGFFYDVSQKKKAGWSVHSWTWAQNVSVPEGESARVCDRMAKIIDELKANNPRIEDTPLFRQHYLGEWVVDLGARVYSYVPGRNDGERPPQATPWCYILGIDLGYNDPTAFVVCAYHEHERALYVIEASKESGLDVTAVAERIRKLMKRYDFEKMIVDNANKQAVEELKRRHELPLSPADKTGKSDFIEIMNGDFIMGNIQLAPAAQPLAEEYEALIWDEHALLNRRREEHPGCANHCADAALYAWRYAYPYLSTAKKVIAVKGTAEWQQEEEDAMRAQAVMAARDRLAQEDEWN